MLTHLIRQSNGNDDLIRTDEQAKSDLISILDLNGSGKNPSIRGGETGWYAIASKTEIFNPQTNNFQQVSVPRSVCFTESTLAGLAAHRTTFGSKYGIAFSRTLLQEKGANPCVNLTNKYLRAKVQSHDGVSRSTYNYIPDPIIPFINVVNEWFDATHEREWRVPGQLDFRWNEMFIIFCPEEDFSTFSKTQTNSLPILFDLAWVGQI